MKGVNLVTAGAACAGLLMNYFGDILIWGVTTPLFALAVLNTGVVPRWIGWVGLVSAFFAGWLGLLSPVSSIVEGHQHDRLLRLLPLPGEPRRRASAQARPG